MGGILGGGGGGDESGMGFFVLVEWTTIVIARGFVVSGCFRSSGAGGAVLDGIAV